MRQFVSVQIRWIWNTLQKSKNYTQKKSGNQPGNNPGGKVAPGQ